MVLEIRTKCAQLFATQVFGKVFLHRDLYFSYLSIYLRVNILGCTKVDTTNVQQDSRHNKENN